MFLHKLSCMERLYTGFGLVVGFFGNQDTTYNYTTDHCYAYTWILSHSHHQSSGNSFQRRTSPFLLNLDPYHSQRNYQLTVSNHVLLIISRHEPHIKHRSSLFYLLVALKTCFLAIQLRSYSCRIFVSRSLPISGYICDITLKILKLDLRQVMMEILIWIPLYGLGEELILFCLLHTDVSH
jgi:hypothetical protein